MREIVQICAAATEWDDVRTGTVWALCNDGTVWQQGYDRLSWFKLPDIPQPLSKGEKAYLEFLCKKEREEGLDNDEKEQLAYLASRDK